MPRRVRCRSTVFGAASSSSISASSKPRSRQPPRPAWATGSVTPAAVASRIITVSAPISSRAFSQ
jgi:hypothetical protein